MTLCACKPSNVIPEPPSGFSHLRGRCFRCLCELRPEYRNQPCEVKKSTSAGPL
jgi:hypothetical protein